MHKIVILILAIESTLLGATPMVGLNYKAGIKPDLVAASSMDFVNFSQPSFKGWEGSHVDFVIWSNKTLYLFTTHMKNGFNMEVLSPDGYMNSLFHLNRLPKDNKNKKKSVFSFQKLTKEWDLEKLFYGEAVEQVQEESRYKTRLTTPNKYFQMDDFIAGYQLGAQILPDNIQYVPYRDESRLTENCNTLSLSLFCESIGKQIAFSSRLKNDRDFEYAFANKEMQDEFSLNSMGREVQSFSGEGKRQFYSPIKKGSSSPYIEIHQPRSYVKSLTAEIKVIDKNLVGAKYAVLKISKLSQKDQVLEKRLLVSFNNKENFLASSEGQYLRGYYFHYLKNSIKDFEISTFDSEQYTKDTNLIENQISMQDLQSFIEGQEAIHIGLDSIVIEKENRLKFIDAKSLKYTFKLNIDATWGKEKHIALNPVPLRDKRKTPPLEPEVNFGSTRLIETVSDFRDVAIFYIPRRVREWFPQIMATGSLLTLSYLGFNYSISNMYFSAIKKLGDESVIHNSFESNSDFKSEYKYQTSHYLPNYTSTPTQALLVRIPRDNNKNKIRKHDIVVFDSKTSRELRRFAVPEDLKHTIIEVAMNQSGDKIIILSQIGSNNNAMLYFFDSHTMKLEGSKTIFAPISSVSTLKISDEGNFIVFEDTVENTYSLYNIDEEKIVWTREYEGLTPLAKNPFVFSPDESMVAVSYKDGNVPGYPVKWKIESTKSDITIHGGIELPQHIEENEVILFSPDSQKIAIKTKFHAPKNIDIFGADWLDTTNGFVIVNLKDGSTQTLIPKANITRPVAPQFETGYFSDNGNQFTALSFNKNSPTRSKKITWDIE